MSQETLHIINKDLSHYQLYQQCLDSMAQGDAIILIESAVFSLCDNNNTTLLNLAAPIYALENDVLARGLIESVPPAVLLADDSTFVELCASYKKTISWF